MKESIVIMIIIDDVVEMFIDKAHLIQNKIMSKLT